MYRLKGGALTYHPFRVGRRYHSRNSREEGDDMAIQFNHTILYAHDSEASAKFLAEMLGLSAPARWGPFVVVKTDNGTNLDFMDTDGELRASTTPSWSRSRISMRSSSGFVRES